MRFDTLLTLGALVGAVVLVVGSPKRLWPVIAVTAAVVEVAIAFGFLHVSVAGISLRLVLGAVLLVSGAAVYLGVAKKSLVTAATVVALVGLLQVVAALPL